MAERTPPPVDETHILDPSNNINEDDDEAVPKIEPNSNSNPNPFSRTAATYVVQVPKDQIYRVPPPENAALAERRQPREADASHGHKKGKLRRCSCCCWCVVLAVAVVLLVGAAAAALLPAVFDPARPSFRVEHVDVLGDATRGRSYKITLRSENPNSKVDLSYAQGGGVSLWFRQQEIATGKFPAFYHAHGSSAAVETVLRDHAPLPKELSARQNGTRGQVSLVLKMNSLSARTEMWTWTTGRVKLAVVCNLTVDSLVPKDSSRVLSQECRTT